MSGPYNPPVPSVAQLVDQLGRLLPRPCSLCGQRTLYRIGDESDDEHFTARARCDTTSYGKVGTSV